MEKMRITLSVLGSLLLLISQGAFANPEDMAQKIVELRESVELLNSEYELQKDSLFNDLKGLATQKAELEARISEEEMLKKQIQGKVSELKKNIQTVSVLGDQVRPLLEENFQSFQSYLDHSLPFKISERSEAFVTLQSKMKTGEITPVKAALQFWSLQEDERRMGKEISLAKQSLDIDGTSYLADVVKVGMKWMYFQLSDGRAGQAVFNKGQWSFQFFDSTDQIEKVALLQDSIKKQIRMGAFDLPLLATSSFGGKQ
ncbi:MAG TPA: hypothetical protein DCL41_07645 [Bdellovibrionales bacterium]|nr:hypothetical protein [Pseudobdellovibrionaceae bacterium]HAG91729.1 hypothetical protein [Bdellovibrionales bacterium]